MVPSNPVMFAISMFIQIFSLLIGGYYLFVSLFGWIPKKDKTQPSGSKKYSYALLVSAHNEEMVIAQLIESLKRQNYDKDCYDIFVIADNCTDNTANVAREAGAIVYERFNDTLKGKGFALEWMFDKLFKMEKQYDYIAIFDADNLVDPNFLTEMNIQANKGHKVVQGYIDSKNPFDSWITCAYSFSFWSISRVFQLARYNLGLSCQLSGTGFIINTETLKELGWGATCLTEDMEFTMKLALNHERVAWAHNAIVYDEKPLTLAQSWRQRVRWMQGHVDVASRFWTKLVKQAIKEKDPVCFDCSVYLIQPVRVIAMGFITFMAWAQTFYPDGNLGFVQMDYLFKNPIIWNAFVAIQFLYMPAVIAFERKQFNARMFIGYITYFVYSLTWVPITIQGFINKNKTEWSHTVHTRQISIDDFVSKQ